MVKETEIHESNKADYDNERDEQLAEMHEHINKVYETKISIINQQTKQGTNVLCLCGGMRIGTAAEALMRAGIPVRNHLDVEIDPLTTNDMDF